MNKILIQTFGNHVGEQINDMLLQQYIKDEKAKQYRQNIIQQFSRLWHYSGPIYCNYSIHLNNKGKTYIYDNNVRNDAISSKKMEIAIAINIRRWIKKQGEIPCPYTGIVEEYPLSNLKIQQFKKELTELECTHGNTTHPQYGLFNIVGVTFPSDVMELMEQIELTNCNINYRITPYSHLRKRGITPLVKFTDTYQWYQTKHKRCGWSDKVPLSPYLCARCPARALKCYVRNMNL